MGILSRNWTRRIPGIELHISPSYDKHHKWSRKHKSAHLGAPARCPLVMDGHQSSYDDWLGMWHSLDLANLVGDSRKEEPNLKNNASMAMECLGTIFEAWMSSLTPLQDAESNMFTMCGAGMAIGLVPPISPSYDSTWSRKHKSAHLGAPASL